MEVVNAALDAARAGARKTRWAMNAAELGLFYERMDRWPLERAAETEERRLGKWLKRQRTAARGGDGSEAMTPARARLLDDIAPGWLDGQDVTWLTRADELVAFAAVHGRMPRDSRRASDEERHTATWLRTQRVSARGGARSESFTDERRAYLDDRVPGWLDDSRHSRLRRWHAIADELGAFHREHGRWPLEGAADPAERRLGRWLIVQRCAAHGGRRTAALTGERRSHLDQVAPDWLTAVLGRERQWQAIADELGDFHREHARWPSQHADDRAERRLAKWLIIQRMGARGTSGASAFTPQRRAHLDQVAPDWLTAVLGRERQWQAIADELGDFHREHARWPSQVAADPAERRLAKWLSVQRMGARGTRGASRFTPQRRAHLDQVAPGWCPALPSR